MNGFFTSSLLLSKYMGKKSKHCQLWTNYTTSDTVAWCVLNPLPILLNRAKNSENELFHNLQIQNSKPITFDKNMNILVVVKPMQCSFQSSANYSCFSQMLLVPHFAEISPLQNITLTENQYLKNYCNYDYSLIIFGLHDSSTGSIPFFNILFIVSSLKNHLQKNQQKNIITYSIFHFLNLSVLEILTFLRNT